MFEHWDWFSYTIGSIQGSFVVAVMVTIGNHILDKRAKRKK